MPGLVFMITIFKTVINNKNNHKKVLIIFLAFNVLNLTLIYAQYFLQIKICFSELFVSFYLYFNFKNFKNLIF